MFIKLLDENDGSRRAQKSFILALAATQCVVDMVSFDSCTVEQLVSLYTCRSSTEIHMSMRIE